ncbi:MAG: hypothetical protein EHM93_03660 [Bacteroidales bacterium]|nr:MAG: hypothetical protein EHM93_03660 [Bacteroidales bacterium]
MKKIRVNILVNILFVTVALCFIGHEVAPHHHHDILKVHNDSCHGNDHHNHKSSCNILNHITPVKQGVSSTIRFDIIKKIIPIDLNTITNNFATNNHTSQILKIFEYKQFKDDDQYIYTSHSLRAPPVA